MTQFAIPNADPVATLTFEDVVTVDVSAFTKSGDYISLALPEFPSTKFNLTKTFIDFTSNEKGNFGVGPTDEIPFSQGTFFDTQTNNDTELRILISKLVKCDKSSITGVRFRLFATEAATFRCLSIRACAETWKYAPIDLNTLWHRVEHSSTPNGEVGVWTNLFTNPSGETTKKISSDGTGWTGTRELETELFPAFIGQYRDKYILSSGTEKRLAAGTFVWPAAGTYVMSLYVWLGSEYDGGKIALKFASDFTKESETVLAETDLTKKGQWQRISTRVKVGSADLIGTYELVCATIPSTSKSTLYTDAMMMTLGSEPFSYFDGSYPGAAWTGTAQASTSTIYRSDFVVGNESPEEGFPVTPTRWPSLFRSNAFQGLSDPEPVNLIIGAAFTAGSFGQASSAKKNELALYFRDVPTDNQTMIEVNTKTMAQLDAAGKQPDFGKALFDARDQEEIDIYDQFELDERTQYTIERKRDESEHTWMEARLKWGATTASNELTLHDADGLGYKWTGMALEASKTSEADKGKYILIVQIKDTWMRAKIYQLNQTGAFISETVVFDTGKITDENLIKRRKGRFGWFANLLDGDAHLDDIKSRGANFGEMISKPFESVTPVKGVQLFTGSTSDKELITGFERTQPEYMTLTPDPNASAGGKAIKVATTPLRPLQGISSNTFQIEEPLNISISFDIRFPASEIPGGQLIGFLLGPNENALPIDFSPYMFDQWSHVKVQMPEILYQTGGYKVIIMQTLPVVATTWWIENLSIKTYSVKWSARAKKPDAWGAGGQRWREAGFTLNSLNGGIVFPERGNQLQIRAQALRQDATISDFKAIPQYATLGRTVFNDALPGETSPKQSAFITSAAKPPTKTAVALGPESTVTWTNPDNIKVEDSSYATSQLNDVKHRSYYLFAYGFEMGIPSYATITGIKVVVNRKYTENNLGGGIADHDMYLSYGTSTAFTGANRALESTNAKWTLSLGNVEYGGPFDLWGAASIPVTTVNGGELSVAMNVNGGKIATAEINYVSMIAYYTVPV